MRRVSVPELLDTDAGTAQEIADSLADLRRINRFLGGEATTRKLLKRVSQQTGIAKPSYLDVGGASSAALQADVTVLDRAASHLQNATGRRVCADAFTLPFRDNSFDAVGSSLLLHHLEPEQVLPFVQESLRVARYGVMINDLRRSRLHFAFAWLGRVIYKSRITTFDSVASVRRAYTPRELAELLQPLNALIEMKRFYFFRVGIVVWKQRSDVQR